MNRVFVMSVTCVMGWMALAQETGTLPAQKVTLRDGTQVTLETQYKTDVKVKEQEHPLRRRMAIFVTNHAGPQFDAAVTRIRTQLAAQVSGSDIEVMDYNEVVAAVKPLMEGVQEADGVEQKTRLEELYAKIGSFFEKDTGSTANGRNATQDQKLLANTSFTRLAEMMGADYVLMVSLDRFSKNTRTLKNKYIDGPIVNEIYKISATYKVLDAFVGTAIGGGTLRAQRSVRQTKNATEELGDYADGLEEELVEQMRGEMLAKASEWRIASKAASGIKVNFLVTAYDMNNKPIYLPKYDGVKNIVNERIPAMLSATVEVDGVAKGVTACTVSLSPGLHKVRLSRPGYDDVVMTITPQEGASFAVSMRMTEGEYNRIKDSVAFMHTLTMERELNQAEVKRLEGEAKRLEQSGFKVDAKELPAINVYRELF